MTTKELEIILESGTESQSIDFKASCPWNASSFAQDILSMTNVQEGGSIIVGVAQKERSFVRKGITQEHKDTYKEDGMKDQIAPFADPHVNFSVSFPKDKNGLEYVVIVVEPFKEIPVICIRDSAKTNATAIYYRNRDGKVESGHVSNAYDLRDILERAAVKLMNKAKDIGYLVPTPEDYKILTKALEERIKKYSLPSSEDKKIQEAKNKLRKERGEL